MLMEAAINIARVIMILFLLFLSFYLDVKIVLMISFMFAAVGAIMVTFMPQSRIDVRELKEANLKLTPQPVKK